MSILRDLSAKAKTWYSAFSGHGSPPAHTIPTAGTGEKSGIVNPPVPIPAKVVKGARVYTLRETALTHDALKKQRRAFIIGESKHAIISRIEFGVYALYAEK